MLNILPILYIIPLEWSRRVVRLHYTVGYFRFIRLLLLLFDEEDTVSASTAFTSDTGYSFRFFLLLLLLDDDDDDDQRRLGPFSCTRLKRDVSL
jgi:hypothetical protein